MFVKLSLLTLLSPMLWALHLGITYTVTHSYYAVHDLISPPLFNLIIWLVTLVCSFPVFILIIIPHRVLASVIKKSEQPAVPEFYCELIRYLSILSAAGIIWETVAILIFAR